MKRAIFHIVSVFVFCFSVAFATTSMRLCMDMSLFFCFLLSVFISQFSFPSHVLSRTMYDDDCFLKRNETHSKMEKKFHVPKCYVIYSYKFCLTWLPYSFATCCTLGPFGP